MKKRIIYIDILRIIGIISIVASDVLRGFVGNNIENNNYTVINTMILFLRFSIPIFFMITGVLIWSLIYSYFEYSKGSKEVFSLIEFIKITSIGIIEGSTFSHLWFIYIILAIYTISPFIGKMLEGCNKKEVEYLLFLWLFANVFYTTFQITYKQLSNRDIEIAFFNIPIILNYTGYFILGYYLERFKIDIKKIKLLVSILFSFFFLLFLELVIGNTNEHMDTYLTFSTFISATSIYLLVKKGKYDKIKDTNKILLKSFSKSAMGVYFIHLIIIIKLKESLITFANPVVYISLNIILVYLISYVFVKLSNLDKKLSYLLGT